MTRKEIQKLLEELSTELKAEIESSRAGLKEAKSITTKLDGLLKKASDWITKLEDPEQGIDAKLQAGEQSSQKIASTVGESETSLEELKQNLATVQANITAMQTAYTEFQQVKSTIDDPNTGLAAVLTAAKQYKAQVQASATNAANLEAKIQQNLATVQANITAMQTAYTEFQQVKTKIDDPDTGLQVILTSSQALKDELSAINKESETIYKEISRFKDSAAKNIASIEAIKTNSEQALETINEQKSESESLKDKISTIFELVSQSGHANYFDKRRRKLVIASWLWLAFSTACILLAIILGLKHIAPLVKVENNSTTIAVEALLVRVSLITPLLALSVFGVTNYNKERRLAEQYAFKAVSASTIEGSIVLLDRSLEKVPDEYKNEAVANFAIAAVTSIHTEPNELTRSTRYKLNAGNKLLQVGGELNDTMETLNKNIEEVVNTKKTK